MPLGNASCVARLAVCGSIVERTNEAHSGGYGHVWEWGRAHEQVAGACVRLQDSQMDIYIGGLHDRNRALNGDLVAVELKPQHQWKVGALATLLRDARLRHSSTVAKRMNIVEDYAFLKAVHAHIR